MQSIATVCKDWSLTVRCQAYIFRLYSPSFFCAAKASVRRLAPRAIFYLIYLRGRRGRDRMVVGFTTTCTISACHHFSCEFESRSGEVYSIQHYVIKFVSDLCQVGGFFPGTPVSFANKTDCHEITEILLKVALNTITSSTIPFVVYLLR